MQTGRQASTHTEIYMHICRAPDMQAYIHTYMHADTNAYRHTHGKIHTHILTGKHACA